MLLSLHQNGVIANVPHTFLCLCIGVLFFVVLILMLQFCLRDQNYYSPYRQFFYAYTCKMESNFNVLFVICSIQCVFLQSYIL